jgi:phosphatidylinositol alpha 1,6-mannosyltransferase
MQQRLRRQLEEITHVSGDELFGQVELVPAQPYPIAERIQRVAILTEAFLPKVDGVTRTSYYTIRYLQQTGRQVLVFAPDISVTSVHGSRVIPLPSVGMPQVPETRLALPHPIIAQELQQFQPDLIHLFSPALMSISGVLMGHSLQVPVVANYQTDVPGYATRYGMPLLAGPVRTWLRLMHNGSDLTLAPTKSVRDTLVEEGYQRVRIWGRGVNIGHFHPQHRSQEMRQRLLAGAPDRHLIALYVGRLATEKRIDLLLEIARLEGVTLVIIGDGAQREELEAAFEGTGARFTGYLYGQSLAEAFASADVFCFPGQNETFGQVVQEAHASGLPTVVIDEGGVADRVDHGVNGFLCPADAAAFASRVALLRDDPALRARMAQAARQGAERRPWSRIMRDLEGHYRLARRVNRFRIMASAGWPGLEWPFHADEEATGPAT